jgi:pimeloyl-ACP methyl ester carboxylesterase
VIGATNFFSAGTIVILVHLIRNEHMSLNRIFSFAVTIFAATQLAAQPAKSGRAVDVKSGDGTMLKGTYFAAEKPGPGVLLFHQSNRTRQSWDDVAAQLAAAGINVLTVDNRGHGESAGSETLKTRPLDQDTAFQFLISQPGVNRDIIGLGGAGVLGVENATEAARRHPAQVKSLVLLSGETGRPQLEFLHQASQLPGLYVFSDEDEYPPIEEAMQLLYANAASPAKKLVHYSAAEEAPWIWYEPFDIGKVPAKGGHGTDLFKPHPELPGIIVHWLVTTLIKTPGHAPADPIAAAAILNDVEFEGGAARAEQKLREARRKDPQAQLWPEISTTTVGEDFLRDGRPKEGVEVFKLNLLAYPDSADVEDNLADAYLADGQKELARQHAQRALTLLDAHAVPASSWTDTEQYRGEIRRDAEKILKQVTEKK